MKHSPPCHGACECLLAALRGELLAPHPGAPQDATIREIEQRLSDWSLIPVGHGEGLQVGRPCCCVLRMLHAVQRAQGGGNACGGAYATKAHAGTVNMGLYALQTPDRMCGMPAACAGLALREWPAVRAALGVSGGRLGSERDCLLIAWKPAVTAMCLTMPQLLVPSISTRPGLLPNPLCALPNPLSWQLLF